MLDVECITMQCIKID